MRMQAALDTGPMLAVREVQVSDRDTGGTLHDRLGRFGAELIVETLDAVADGTAHERPQPLTGISYAEKISKAEALIDWRDDASSVWRRVRAFNPWPIAETTLNGAQLRVWEAEMAPNTSSALDAPSARCEFAPPGTVLTASNDGIDVACGRGALRILRLQLAGRKPLAAQEFIKAQRLAGARFASP
jgi:methionyl-tRNA formyltransferase